MSEERVVVGVDESATSQVALEWAMSTAERHSASVEAVHVWRWNHPGLGLLVPDAPASIAAAARQFLDAQIEKALADRPHGAAALAVAARTPEGDPAAALLAAAAEAGLLVLGRHGQGSWLRRVMGPSLGSVASYCLTHAFVPVAIIPPSAPAAPPRRVVVGVDGSPASARALRWAVGHARAIDVPVVAVLAWQMTTVPAPASTCEDWSVPPLSDWEAVARGLLEATVEQALDATQAAAVDRLVLYRPAAAGLLETIRTDDLLVLGERGRGGFPRLLLGSVSRQCAEHAPCPVVIVPGRARHLQEVVVGSSTS